MYLYWRISPCFFQLLLGFPGFYWVFLGFTRFYRVLQGFTGFYWVCILLWIRSGIQWFSLIKNHFFLSFTVFYTMKLTYNSVF